jgi:hypothetical protein
MSHLQADANLSVSRALPASASATVNSTSIDLGHGTGGRLHADCEFEVAAPAVNTTMAPDTRTFTYKLQHSTDNSNFTDIANAVITQTGAGGAGAAAASFRWRAPSNVNRYVRLAITSGVSTTDASAVAATLKLFT